MKFWPKESDRKEKMDLERIKKLADFFYSSNSSNDVPLRLSCLTGRYTGIDLNKESFIAIFVILNRSTDLKKDLAAFLEQYHE
jgi:hypothetical protein